MPPIPYKIAVLVYVFNDQGKLLLLRRSKHPNKDLYSPIGGKLEQHLGESPYACALREIQEEIGVTLSLDHIHLLGIVSERAYDNAIKPVAAPLPPVPGVGPAPTASHWLMFCFEVASPVNIPGGPMNEGVLEWVDPIIVPQLNIPKTDREVIWPLVQRHSMMLQPAKRRHDSFFSVHIDCTDADNFIVTHEHPRREP